MTISSLQKKPQQQSKFTFQPEHFTLGINEHGTSFDEDIAIDEERDTVLFRVPPHNNVDGASFLNDFKLVSKHMT